ncbi:chaplin [Streptomyces sp. NBC_01551]|uniref:chaplin n=1 Tax=Streptomyces sp. NBC_01551 TaxID=2975876 RepID=UPI002252C949|nr:chaplin [Streptomyces sp. NBC_01551]MCX4526321.1 chaplin [Streptomyces sp. NBC_01551]
MRQVLSRQVLGKGMLTAAAASSLLSIATGAAYAHPGATAEASHSPGVLSGNSVSVPITFTPNVCGNSVDGGAALNPAMGNTCATSTGSHVSRDEYEHHLSPEHAEAFERYLDESRGRHALPRQREEEHGGYGEERAHEEQRHPAPRHAAPRHEERHDEGGYGDSEERGGGEEECDDHPRPEAQRPAPAPPAPPRSHPRPAPEHPAPQPRPKPVPAPEMPAPAPAPQARSRCPHRSPSRPRRRPRRCPHRSPRPLPRPPRRNSPRRRRRP